MFPSLSCIHCFSLSGLPASPWWASPWRRLLELLDHARGVVAPREEPSPPPRDTWPFYPLCAPATTTRRAGKRLGEPVLSVRHRPHMYVEAGKIEQMLGLVSIAILLDHYSHVLPDMQSEAVAALARVLEG